MKRDEFDETMKAYLTGEQTPQDPTVAYCLSKYVAARAEFAEVVSRVGELEKVLAAAKERVLVLQGEVNGRAADLEHWMGLEEEADNGRGRNDEAGSGVRSKTTTGLGGVQVTDRRTVGQG